MITLIVMFLPPLHYGLERHIIIDTVCQHVQIAKTSQKRKIVQGARRIDIGRQDLPKSATYATEIEAFSYKALPQMCFSPCILCGILLYSSIYVQIITA